MHRGFQIISTLLLLLVGAGYFLSYTEGFLDYDRHALKQSFRFWERPVQNESSRTQPRTAPD